MNFLNKMERKFGKYAIRGLMKYVSIIYVVFYVLMIVQPSVYSVISFNKYAILNGEFWRVITFAFNPPSRGILGLLIIYVYYWIGNSLENIIGSFRFNLFYFMGIIMLLISGFIFSSAIDSMFIHLTMFIAFARFNPNMEFRLYFVLPVKVKYLALLDWAFLIYYIIGVPYLRFAAIFAILNYLIFFGVYLKEDILMYFTVKKNKAKFESKKMTYKSEKVIKGSFHKCSVCGITENDDPQMEFRYDYDGKEYCMDHLDKGE